MLILLPPSEGKTSPRRGKPLDLTALSHDELTPTRARMLDALVDLCGGDAETARTSLDLSSGQAELVDANARLATAPTAAASRVYTGVLYDALGLATLSASAKRRASSRVRIVSALWGVVSPTDRIPAYRLSAGARLGIGKPEQVWRPELARTLDPIASSRLVVDLRSGPYASFWRPSPQAHVAKVRVLHESGGKRSVVSHFNKATKGRIVRDLLEHGGTPRRPEGLAQLLTELGWQVEATPDPSAGNHRSFDVIVREL